MIPGADRQTGNKHTRCKIHTVIHLSIDLVECTPAVSIPLEIAAEAGIIQIRRNIVIRFATTNKSIASPHRNDIVIATEKNVLESVVLVEFVDVFLIFNGISNIPYSCFMLSTVFSSQFRPLILFHVMSLSNDGARESFVTIR